MNPPDTDAALKSATSAATRKTVAEYPGQPARSLFWLALAALAVCAVTVVAMTAYSRNMEHWVEHTTAVYQTTRSGLLDLTGPIASRQPTPSLANPGRAIARFDS